jgi:late competence protein required for DNA uptake (superfamily II DNA/RNA helicase)
MLFWSLSFVARKINKKEIFIPEWTIWIDENQKKLKKKKMKLKIFSKFSIKIINSY